MSANPSDAYAIVAASAAGNAREDARTTMASTAFLVRSHVVLSALTLFLLLVTNLWENPIGVAARSVSERNSCLANCRNCQQLFGLHFRGPLCARTCRRLRGREPPPNCLDFEGIAPYLDLDTNRI